MYHKSLLIRDRYYSTTRKQVIELASPVEIPKHKKDKELVGVIVRYKTASQTSPMSDGGTCTYTVLPEFTFVHNWNLIEWRDAPTEAEKKKLEITVSMKDLRKIGFAPVNPSQRGSWPR